MFTKLFWMDTLERAIRTFAQGFLSVTTLASTGWLEANWDAALMTGAVAAFLSVVTSLVSSGSGNSASFVVDAKKMK